jgi:dTDP-4-amino-4,6-dideoxygalactose transaminase
MIPFVDLKAQYQSIKDEVNSAVLQVLESCQFVLGPEVGAFEEEFAAYCGTSHALGTSSGTSALHLALLAAGIGPGDEVITTPFTFVATVAAIYYTGATPVFVDIDPRSFTLDPGRLEAAVTNRTKAVLPVHLYGQPADMDPIMEIARARGLVVIEDAAQAHGAEYKGRRVGGIGDLGCFSFYPGKNLGAYGEGGLVATNNPKYARTVRMLRDWGAERKYHHELKGYNYRLEGIQGAVLRVKLRHIEAWTEARRKIAAEYDLRLKDFAAAAAPEAMPYARHVYHVYAVRVADRSSIQEALDARGIQTGIHYPIPVHLLPAYADLGYHEGDFPESERAATEVLSLPMFAELSVSQAQTVAGALREAAGG